MKNLRNNLKGMTMPEVENMYKIYSNIISETKDSGELQLALTVVSAVGDELDGRRYHQSRIVSLRGVELDNHLFELQQRDDMTPEQRSLLFKADVAYLQDREEEAAEYCSLILDIDNGIEHASISGGLDIDGDLTIDFSSYPEDKKEDAEDRALLLELGVIDEKGNFILPKDQILEF